MQAATAIKSALVKSSKIRRSLRLLLDRKALSSKNRSVEKSSVFPRLRLSRCSTMGIANADKPQR